MIITIIFCILSPYTFAADNYWADPSWPSRAQRRTSRESTSRTPNQSNPEQFEHTFAADGTWADTPRPQPVHRRTSRESTSRTPNQNNPEQFEHTFAADGTLLDTPRPQPVQRRASRASTSRIPNQYNLEQFEHTVAADGTWLDTSQPQPVQRRASLASTSRIPNQYNLEQFEHTVVADGTWLDTSQPQPVQRRASRASTSRIPNQNIPEQRETILAAGGTGANTSRPQRRASRASTSRTQNQQLAPNLIPEENTCSQWICAYGFGDNYAANFVRSQEFPIDYGFSLWAASYMYGLFQIQYYFRFIEYTPMNFCEKHVHTEAKYSHIPLKDAEFSCEGWIYFYGYDHKYNFEYNYNWITNRNFNMDPYISIWAKTYFDFITFFGQTMPITSKQFCEGIGHRTVPLPEKYPFMKIDGSNMSCKNHTEYSEYDVFNLGVTVNCQERCVENKMPRLKFRTKNDTYMSCLSWIYEYGYTDATFDNIRKIINRNQIYDEFLPHWTKLYVETAHAKYKKNKIRNIRTPKGFCINSHKMLNSNHINFDGKTLFQVQHPHLDQGQSQDQDQNQYQDQGQDPDEDD